MIRISVALATSTLVPAQVSWASPTKKCLFVSAYHRGYAWNDGIEAGVRKTLAGRCELRQFDLDTKRNPSPASAKKRAAEAKALIETWHPDVVIVSDDNTSRYLVQPYFKDHKVPFVFCGVNWSGQDYGYPYSNVTGMIEVNAIKPLLDQVLKVRKDAKKAVCLGVDNETDHKLCERFAKAGAAQGIETRSAYVLTFSDWKKAFLEAQKSDFVLLPTNAGINDWKDAEARSFVLANTRKLTVATYDWMTPFAILSMTNVAEEQGEYAAQVAIRILEGAKPADIPIISNRRWITWVNIPLSEAAKIPLPPEIVEKAERVR